MHWRIKRALQPAAWSVGMFAFHYGSRNPRTLRWLSMGWGNESMSADTSFLEAACRWASQVRGPILECGSGLTTLLLGMVAPGRITTLEHMPEWKARVQVAAKELSVPVNVLNAPLVDYGGFHWYTLPESLQGNYELVICDGPPSLTIGGRYGLFPIGRSLLAKNAVVLVDDMERPDEQAIIERWKSEFGIFCNEYDTFTGTHAEVRLEKPAESDCGFNPMSRTNHTEGLDR